MWLTSNSQLIPSRVSHFSDFSRKAPWQPLQTNGHEANEVYWLKISFPEDAPEAASDYLLSLGKNIDKATLFLPNGKQYQSGRLIPANKKRVTTRFKEVFFRFSYYPKAGDTFFIRLEERSGMPPVINPKLIDFVSWEEESTDQARGYYLLQGLFYGMVWIMVIYNLAIFLTYFERVYVQYAIYLMGISIFAAQSHGLLDELVIFNNPELSIYLRSFGIHLGGAFYFGFMRGFLNTKDDYPKVDHIFLWFQRVLGANFILATFVLALTGNVRLYRLESSLVFGIVFLVSVVIAVQLFAKYPRSVLLRYFIGGLLSLVLSGLLAILLYFFNFKEVRLGSFAEIGTAFEIIFFSLGLGYRMKRRERVKSKLEAENARLLDEQNKDLESQIGERTKELKSTTEEIQIQNAELKQQQEELLSQRNHIEGQNTVLLEREMRLNDSFRYARTIQQSILSVEEKLERALVDHFIFYRPKDIVSGDFYWVEEVEGYQFWAVADCTGHGVPGAFMSIMGVNLLKEVVREAPASRPAQLLDKFDERVHTALSRRTDNNNDRINIALCCLAWKENGEVELSYAGAKQPLYYLDASNRENGVQRIRGTRRSIGANTKKNGDFEQFRCTLPAGSTVYLASDGFSDQHNIKGEKMGTARFHALLETVSTLPFDQQAAQIENYFNKHRSGQFQRDDVTVLGIQLR